MSARLEITVLAVGQGSCNLVEEYDDQDNLIYLALLDCGKEKNDTTMEEANLISQMEIIKAAMRKRGEYFNFQYGEHCTDMYLDHVIISHRDTDHLFFLTEEYLFKDLIPSALAMQKTNAQQYEKIRLRYKPRKKQENRNNEGGFVLELEDENSPHLFRWCFQNLNDPIKSVTSAEYEYSDTANLTGGDEQLGYLAQYEGTYTFLHQTYFDFQQQQMLFVNTSSVDVHHIGVDQMIGYSGNVNVELEHKTDGTNSAWIWNIELLDSKYAKDTSEHTDILYDLKISFMNLEGAYVLGVEATVHYDYAGYPGIENGNIYIPREISGDYPYDISIQEVLHRTAHDILQVLQTTPYCPEPLRGIYLQWTLVGFQYLHYVVSYLCECEAERQKNVFDVKSTEQIFNYVFTEVYTTRDDPSVLLIGNIYVGGNKPAQTHDLAKHAILKTLEYSMNFEDVICPATDIEITAQISTLHGQILPKWYLSSLFLLRMPAEYYFDECGIPKTKDTYREYAMRQMNSRKNAIRKANENDCSILSVFHYPASEGRDAFNYVIPGDATHNTMHHLISVWSQAKPELKSCGSLMVAPHHGSFVTCRDLYRGDKTEAVLYVFLNIFNTKSIIISAGCPSHYCHPHNSFIWHACRILTNLSEQQDGFYYNTTDKGRGARPRDYQIGVTRRYLMSTAYFELRENDNNILNYVNHTAIGEANIENIHYVQQLFNMPQIQQDMEELCGV